MLESPKSKFGHLPVNIGMFETQMEVLTNSFKQMKIQHLNVLHNYGKTEKTSKKQNLT